MSLLAVAEVMSGEALVSPGGPIDRETAVTDDVRLWQHEDSAVPQSKAERPETVPHPVLEKVLAPV